MKVNSTQRPMAHLFILQFFGFDETLTEQTHIQL